MKIFIRFLNACLIIIGLFLMGYSIDKLFSWGFMFLGFGCEFAAFYLDDLTKDKDNNDE